MISDLDKNKSGSIDFEEFLDMMTARMSDKDTREDISKVFRLFDDDTSGSITLRNLRRVAKELAGKKLMTKSQNTFKELSINEKKILEQLEGYQPDLFNKGGSVYGR